MTSTAIAKADPVVKGVKAELERFSPSYTRLLPKWYPADRLITGALVALQANPDLQKCTPRSIVVALAKVAQMALDVGDTAHLVPFGTTCTAIADYKGLVKLMCEAGARKVEAREVREGDTFSYRYGTEPTLNHTPGPNRSGRITHCYAVVWLRGGVTQFEVMTAEEVDQIRTKHSKSWKSGPLEAWYGRKCVIRRLSKYVPRTPRLAAALTDEGFDPETGEVLNPEPIIEIPETVTAIRQGDAFEPEDDGA